MAGDHADFLLSEGGSRVFYIVGRFVGNTNINKECNTACGHIQPNILGNQIDPKFNDVRLCGGMQMIVTRTGYLRQSLPP